MVKAPPVRRIGLSTEETNHKITKVTLIVDSTLSVELNKYDIDWLVRELLRVKEKM